MIQNLFRVTYIKFDNLRTNLTEVKLDSKIHAWQWVHTVYVLQLCETPIQRYRCNKKWFHRQFWTLFPPWTFFNLPACFAQLVGYQSMQRWQLK